MFHPVRPFASRATLSKVDTVTSSEPVPRSRRSRRAAVMGASAIVTFGVGAFLLRSRACETLPIVLILSGVVLGLVVAIIGVVSFVRARRPAALLVLLGIVPIL